MAKNTLYNFIDLYINGKKGLANVIALKPMETRDKKKYFLLQLKLSKAIYFKSNKQVLELVEHHISIYKTEHSYDPALSQYHYTAKLEGPNKTFYTLHVYFNENGQITKAPVLSLIENEKPSPVQITEKKACQFVAQAEAAIRPTIMQLNAAKIECIDQLKRQFEEEDEKATALSTDLKSNAVQHKLVIQKMINLARQLNPLFKHEKYAMSAQMLGELQYSPTPERKKAPFPCKKPAGRKSQPPTRDVLKLLHQ